MTKLIQNLPMENASEGVIEIFLRTKDDFNSQYDNNPNNLLKGQQVIKMLSSGPFTCYFQKQKSDAKNRSRHKIIIPFEDEKAFEFSVSLKADKLDAFADVYSYYMVKFKEKGFFSEPIKNTIKRTCIFKFLDVNKIGGSDSAQFKELYKAIDNTPVPVVDVNKEKDRSIWQNYVEALKRLIKQKEHVWKIKNVSKPYFEAKEGENDRATYIDIYINEKDLIKQLQEDLLTVFKKDELEDYGVSEEKAFIEFNTYREQVSQNELLKLTEIGEKLFYEMADYSPIHYIAGDISFKSTDDKFKSEVIADIRSRLWTDYQLEAAITENGLVDLEEEQLPHLKKIVEANYPELLNIYKDNLVQLKVSFENEIEDLGKLSVKVKRKLDNDGLTRSSVYPSDENQLLIVEVPSYIPPNKFSEDNLIFSHHISRFAPDRRIDPRQINGLEFSAGTYQITNASKPEIEYTIDLLRTNFPGVNFTRRPTLFFFKPSQEADLNKRREFKTNSDLKGKSEFIILTSILKITAENEPDFKAQIRRIKEKNPGVSLENKPYSPTNSLQFRSDVVSYRQTIINKLQNELRSLMPGEISFDTIKNYSKVLFRYTFKTEEERELFKDSIKQACDKYKEFLSLSFENGLGKTVYELYKNEILEDKKEQKLISNIRQATFVYMTPEQLEQLNDAIEQFGVEARFKEGIAIGTLVRKEKDKLKFRITENFDKLLTGKESERIELDEIVKGSVKPIFPGELTNIDRMIRAMRKVTEPGNYNGYPVNKNLPNFLFDPTEARESAMDFEELKQKVISNLNEPLLITQPKQLEAVTKALAAKDLVLIQGPPGTGKTTVIAEIIWQILSDDPQAKILITSQTNLAVDNALERLAGKKLVRPIRIGNIDKFENEGKVYSNDRIRKWLYTNNEEEESLNKDNAINEWIENVKEKCSTEGIYARAVEKWKQGLNKHDPQLKGIFGKSYYKYVNVFAATCSECGSRNFSEAYQSMFQSNGENQMEPEFDVVIMDEASKATPPELVLPLTLGRKVIIMGDHKQLPPMIDEKEFTEALESIDAKKLIEHWTKEDYKISQFEKLFKNAPKSLVASLDTQFRMHAQIMNCISQFYTDQEELVNGLICGIRDDMDIPDFKVKGSRWHGLKSLPFIDTHYHAIWVNVETPEGTVGSSYENEGEVCAIKTVLNILSKSFGFDEYYKSFAKDEDKEIGIITYYMPQMQRIRNTLYPHLRRQDWRDFEQRKFENEFQLPFRINTVDRFQGMERNIVIISTVRSNKQIRTVDGRKIIADNNKYPFALGFAKELQRVNVGFSRAKRLLIVIGNEAHFSHKPEYEEAQSKMHRVDIAQLQNLNVK